MAAASLTSTSPVGSPGAGPWPAYLAEAPLRAPLLPVAAALTLGILLDRHISISLTASLLVTLASLAAWVASHAGGKTRLAQLYLLLAALAWGAGYHHWYCQPRSDDDISNYAAHEPRIVQMRGVVVDGPITHWPGPRNPLATIPRQEWTGAVVAVTHLRGLDDWQPVSGRVRLHADGQLQGIHRGDEITATCWLTLPRSPANPGEVDQAARLRDDGIHAIASVEKSPDAVTLRTEGWKYSLHGWLDHIRGQGQQALQRELPTPESGVAMALLLGEGSTMSGPEVEKYLRTGVIHALAISGQHLVVLAWFLWQLARLMGLRRRRIALLVAGFLLLYALITGGKPPVMRAAVGVLIFCGGIVFRRADNPANTLALAWIVVAILHPTDMFTPGCQLSFLAVAVIYGGHPEWRRRDMDPLDRLIEENDPRWRRWLRHGGRWLLEQYAVGALVWAAVSPLTASHYHTISLPALVIGPPVVLLTSVALIAGFLLLLVAFLCPPLTVVFAWPTYGSLWICDQLVNVADRFPGAHWYLPDLPAWWVWAFYAGLLLVLLLPPWRAQWRWLAVAWLIWLCMGMLAGSYRAARPELVVTFLAVGHGGCTVVETPDGRTLIYDAGAMRGPDITRRQIAPYLWQRGIRRVDEVYLSHAHLDHFNGLLALLERFEVSQVTATPSLAESQAPGILVMRQELQRRGIALRIVKTGDRIAAGGVEMEVLHPPLRGPAGSEDARSLVLLLRHDGHSLLLTGDLQGEGLKQLRLSPRREIHVLMAPHHGSRYADPEGLADWARPTVVVSSQAPPPRPQPTPAIYEKAGAEFLPTWQHGAVTIRSGRGQLVIETFLTRRRIVVMDSQER